MHSKNIHKNGYDFDTLTKAYPPLSPFMRVSTKAKPSIDFANPDAVKCLNAALLAVYYNTLFWDIPKGFLCPAVPGRADYIHHLADLLATQNEGKVPTGKRTRGLDIGAGANLIYPILGSQTYGWKFVAVDVSDSAYKSAKTISETNAPLKKLVTVRKQTDAAAYFSGVINPDEYFDFTMCNPPFHASSEVAQQGNLRKLKGLQHHQNKRTNAASTTSFQAISKNPQLNFGGQHNELWCLGGELKFVSDMIKESINFKTQVGWFTCLVSKSSHLPALEKALQNLGCPCVKIIEMSQGNKISRFIAWTYKDQNIPFNKTHYRT